MSLIQETNSYYKKNHFGISMDSTGESSPLLLTSVPVSMSCYLCCFYVVIKTVALLSRGLAGVFVSVFATFFLLGEYWANKVLSLPGYLMEETF